ncbi:F-box protein-like protein [Salvia divinorum]|uniref:F-box protein-like protein n=1 Tax=Salvia divinorum TaxID=28513 RepID=A0ABD1HH98_SALDI
MGSNGSDLCRKIYGEKVEEFDRLPDAIILLIFNRIGDVKALGRCCTVSRRFHSLVPQVDNVVINVDCVISDEERERASSTAADSAAVDKSRRPIASFFRIFFSGLFNPLHSLSQVIPSARQLPLSDEEEEEEETVTHHSPMHVLKNFNEIKVLRIVLPAAELTIENGVVLRWKAEFGSTLESSVILGAESIASSGCGDYEANDDIAHESFYSDGGLKLRVLWTVATLISASARHYLLQPIIAEHETLESLVLMDADGLGSLSMNKDQLDDLRVRPLSASPTSKRTRVPSLDLQLWYAPRLEMPNGAVLKGATLIAIKPSELQREGALEAGSESSWAEPEGNWISSAFEGPFATAARMLVKKRIYCLEMNAF